MLYKLVFLPLMINTFRLVLFALSQSKFWKRLEKILKAAGYFAMHLTPPTADQRGIVYVIYNDGEWLTYPDVWDPSRKMYCVRINETKRKNHEVNYID